MATESFFRDLVIRSDEAAEKIIQALESNEHAYADLPPAHIDEAQEKEFVERWCALLKKGDKSAE